MIEMPPNQLAVFWILTMAGIGMAVGAIVAETIYRLRRAI